MTRPPGRTSWEGPGTITERRANICRCPSARKQVGLYWLPSGFLSGGLSSFFGSTFRVGGCSGFGCAVVFVVEDLSSFFSASRSLRDFNRGSTVHLETR